MLAPLFGYFFTMIAVLTAAVVLLTSFSDISLIRNGRNHLRPAGIGRTVTVEVQRHSPVAKEASPAKDVAPVAKEASPAKDISRVVATAKADTQKGKHYKLKVFARQRDNYGYGNAPGYANQSWYGSRGPFFQ
jgi:uncharacterized protein (DUF58 family)